MQGINRKNFNFYKREIELFRNICYYMKAVYADLAHPVEQRTRNA